MATTNKRGQKGPLASCNWMLHYTTAERVDAVAEDNRTSSSHSDQNKGTEREGNHCSGPTEVEERDCNNDRT